MDTSAGKEGVDARAGGGPRHSLSAWLDRPITLRLLSLAAVLTIWQLVGVRMPLQTSYPSAIIQAAYETMASDVLPAFVDTATGFAVGYLIAVVLGVPIGLLMARSRIVELALKPYVFALNATPRIAFIPLLILWLGLTFQMRVAVVVMSGIFPIMVNTYLGAKEVDRELLDTGLAFDASRHQMLKTIVFPASLPYTFAGLRIGMGRSLIGIIVAEIESSVIGVGHLIDYNAQTLQIAEMFVPIIMLGVFSILFTAMLVRFERWATMPWLRRRKATA